MTPERPSDAKSPVRHVLLTVLGIQPSEALYALNGQTRPALLAPLALLSLLPADQRPDAVVALCTPEASTSSLPHLEEQLPQGCSLTEVKVPSGHSQDDINTFLSEATEALRKATEAVPRPEPHPEDQKLQLSLDVTHGFRHFSFLTYLAGLYFVSLRDAELKGAWYGLLSRDQESPFLDLKPLLELPLWIHALQVLKATGSALPIATALQRNDSSQNAQRIADELRLISESYLSGLPLELGRQVQLFRSQRLKPMRKLLNQTHQLPLAAELVSGLDRFLQPYAITALPSGSKWKTKLPLTREELQRQAGIIDSLFEHQDDAIALRLLNEWTVSWAVWCGGQTDDWLDFAKTRRRAAGQLHAIREACQSPELRSRQTEEQQALGDIWHWLTNLRNGFAHHGMRSEELVGNNKTKKELDDVKSYWQTTLRACPSIALRLGDGEAGPLLVTPIGNRPGVLFSALLACRDRLGHAPSSCLVICSAQSKALIGEAAAKAGFSGTITPLTVEDPFGGINEFERLRQEAQQAFLSATSVLVNVTGGTTLLGLAAQDLADQARTFARPVQRFGLIDRRPPSAQEAAPYEAGEPFWLEGHAEEVA